MFRVLLLCLLLAPMAPAPELQTSDPVTVTALAVAETSQGLRGVAASVQATAIADGDGQVFVDTKPLAQTDMQGSARQAARVAADLLGLDWRRYDYLVVFRSESAVIGGPSAGAVMSLAIATALWNLEHPEDPWILDPGVAATGTINPDGSVGPVGGVPAKAQGAADAGIHLFLYPTGLETFATAKGQVSMTDHCRHLGITCRPVGTLRDLVAAAAGVRLDRPPIEVPGTADYGEILGPLVEPEIARLAQRLQGLEGDSAALASSRLAEAQEAYGQEQFYTAATRAFQGHIQAAYAENLTRFLPDGDEAVVIAAINTCQQAIDAPSSSPDTAHGLLARGAAQRRSYDAEALLESAKQRYQVGRDQWAGALFDAAFCTERARTAQWWDALGTAFGPGPAVDAQAYLQDALDEAREMVVYASAVLGIEVQTSLEEAFAHARAGRIAGALLAAVDAKAQASVAMQVGTGAPVSEDVLGRAREAAAEAILRARAAGIEPILAVAMLELSDDLEQEEARLVNLWGARSLALLLVEQPAPAPEVERITRQGFWDGVVTGVVAGAIVVAIPALVVIALVVSLRPAPRAKTGAPQVQTPSMPELERPSIRARAGPDARQDPRRDGWDDRPRPPGAPPRP